MRNTMPDSRFPVPLTNENANKGVPFVEAVVEKAPPWLFSAALHLVLMIVLALLVSQIPPSLTRELIVQSVVVELDDAPVFSHKIGDPEQPVSVMTGNDSFVEAISNSVLSPNNVGDEGDPINEWPEIDDPYAMGFGTENSERAPVHSLIDGRDPNVRRTAMFSGGGTETTEMAVLKGLRWLAWQQYAKGYWSLRRGPRGNSYDATGVDNWVAATGLALLAFQGHGETTERGEFKDNVKKGWAWLLEQQEDDGCFYRPEKRTSEDRNHPLYTHGICTIAICELYAMTRDPVLKEQLRLPAQKAIDYCVKTQTSSGGWKYGLNNDQSDLSVTGWIVMALHSGRIAGLEVPQETLDRVMEFLDDVSEAGSKYLYEKESRAPTRSMTAEGLLCRQILGWDRDDPRLLEGANWLIQPENLICFTGRDEMGRRNPRDVYYWYYATLMFHNLGGRHWNTWNNTMMQRVCENQQRNPGENEGSWSPVNSLKPATSTQDIYASEGRLYVTCLSIYMLEVYYRHLPLYRAVR